MFSKYGRATLLLAAVAIAAPLAVVAQGPAAPGAAAPAAGAPAGGRAGGGRGGGAAGAPGAAAAPGGAAAAGGGRGGGGGGAAAGGGRGGGGGYDYNISGRTAEDKALPNPYARDETWYHMPAGRYIGGTSGIAIDRKDGVSVWIIERCGGRGVCNDSTVAPIIHFAPDGHIIKMFGAKMVSYPHGLYVDKDDNVWITDLQIRATDLPGFPKAGATVLKFSPDGKLLMTLGTPGVYGHDATHFSQPSDVVTSDVNGDIFVADSHDSAPSNAVIVKFDKNGKFIKEWPSCRPEDTSRLDCGHSLAIDKEGRLYNANRGNNAIDIYDQDGNFIQRWKQFGKPSGLFIDANDILYSSDSQSGTGNQNSFVKGVHIGSAKTGVVTAFLPDPLGLSSPWSGASTLSPEGVAADKNGVIYISQVTPPGLARYTLNKNVAPPAPAGAGRGGAAGGGAAGGRGGAAGAGAPAGGRGGAAAGGGRGGQ